jgi:hypothetical protein
MRARLALLATAVLATTWLSASSARADQRADYMLEGSEPGDYLLLDYFGTGGQLTLQRSRAIYGKANELTTGVNALIGYPLAHAQAFTNLRILFLELGGLIGYRNVWRNLSFAPGKDTYCSNCDRKARRKMDPLLGRGLGTDEYVFAEGKLQLYAPFNEYVVFTSQLVARYEDSKDRSYDWFFTSIHDGGVISRSETMLFFKHRDWGGIAPYLQVMLLPRDGQYDTEVAYGFNAVRRMGLLARNDLLFFTFLIRPGDRYYGQHNYYSPVRALLVYRLMLAL